MELAETAGPLMVLSVGLIAGCASGIKTAVMHFFSLQKGC
jgi:hypothetical protein